MTIDKNKRSLGGAYFFGVYMDIKRGKTTVFPLLLKCLP